MLLYAKYQHVSGKRYVLDTCPLGHPVAESDLCLRTSELARFGRLLLDDGGHEGRQLIPAGYCARIAAESVATVNDPEDKEFRLAPRYGLGAWDPGGLSATRRRACLVRVVM